ncbi:portal protein [Arthrobacter phage Amigo]|uniref:Portal protein n=8 Tax=Amigovirus amigo TaxID=1982100 RepID=A0A5J6TEZ4_9CAUD|nr:portal protein [Arthrobacter phage Amigo]ALY08468.1 portal protein [Arthrobacter phage Anansi]ALY09082.1 portal protein [Arthrobacter phage Gorgeous]ALY10363.1 portal protein [Arthrobacter phage SorJuana]QFG08317.1 portal protein [Arthrobacter phage Yeezus]QFG13365.1 portal protein [Arthrobacter phage Ichor]QFG13883.1 portal protein [Arthrobacter phage Jaek]QJD51670.1 portal protein [Arthrobacter phage Boersma]
MGVFVSTEQKLEETTKDIQLNNALWQVEQLQESLADIVLAIDDRGWRPMGDDTDVNEIPLKTVKDTALITRGLLASNPIIKRGIAVRTSYVHGQGCEFEGISETDPLIKNVKNYKWFFSPQADAENESLLSTDGNMFTLMTRGRGRGKGNGTLERIPMRQITGTVSNPDNPEDIWFYKRVWDSESVNYRTEDVNKKAKQAYYPADDYDPVANGRPATIAGVKVVWESAILHTFVNRQVGWKWGVPDLMTVIWWSKAYKEFLETMQTLTKAYARFAWKVTASTPAGVNSVASKVAAQPTRDPYTGAARDVGGTAGLTSNMNLQSVGRSSNSVDFGAGLPLAAMVAAGLEIPLTTLTSDAGSANRSAGETLSEPTIKAMEMRQKVWTTFYERVFAYFGKTVKVVWPKIESEPTLKRVQAMTTAMSANVLHAQEVRDYLVSALGIDNDNKLPTEEELGLLILAAKQAEEQADKAAAAKANQPASANPSYGDHENRDVEGARQYEPGTYGKEQ